MLKNENFEVIRKMEVRIVAPGSMGRVHYPFAVDANLTVGGLRELIAHQEGVEQSKIRIWWFTSVLDDDEESISKYDCERLEYTLIRS